MPTIGHSSIGSTPVQCSSAFDLIATHRRSTRPPISMSVADTQPTSLRHHRPFALYWVSRVSSTVALQMQAVAVGWQMYDITHNPLDLGLVGLTQFIPAALFVLVAGHVADRYDRRMIVRICQMTSALATATLAIGTAGGCHDARIAARRGVRHRLGARLRADHDDHAAAGHRAAVAAVARHRRRRIGDADRRDRRTGDGRAALRGQPGAGLCAVLHALPHVQHPDRPGEGRAHRDLARAAQPRRAVRRLPLHPAQPGHPRRHLARSVRRHPRRRLRAAAGVRARRVPCRPVGARPAARVARRRRADRRHDPGAPAAAPAGRPDHVRRGRRPMASPSSCSRCRIRSCCRWRCSPCSARPT